MMACITKHPKQTSYKWFYTGLTDAPQLEVWVSGLNHSSAKGTDEKLSRRFESFRFRH